MFLLAPLVTCDAWRCAAWAVIPVSAGWVIANINVGILYIFAISSLGVYGVIMAGWASNSKYPFLAALRSAAQMVSYEVSIGFVIITVLLCAARSICPLLSRRRTTRGGCSAGTGCRCFRCWFIFFVSALAETNRPAVRSGRGGIRTGRAGFMVEYGSTPYMMFMLGEYVAISTMCAMLHDPVSRRLAAAVQVVPFTSIPALIWFVLKALFVFFMFAMVKAFVPRYRYDQLMRLGWKVFLPISLAIVRDRRRRAAGHRMGAQHERSGPWIIRCRLGLGR